MKVAVALLTSFVLLAACGGDDGDPIVPAENGSVRGTVTDDTGASVANAGVALTGNGQAGRSTTTAADGAYAFDDVPPGTYTLTVTPPAGFTVGGAATISVTVESETQADVSAFVLDRVSTNGSVRGVVTDGAGGVPNVTLELSASGQAPRSTTTGSDGIYLFADVAPGTYELTIAPPSGYTLKAGGATSVSVVSGIQANLSPFLLEHDSCVTARPDFGGPATAADLALFDYDVDAPLNLVQTIDSAADGVQFSTISYTSPDGGSVPGILVEPLGRTGPLPAIVIMHAAGYPATIMQGYAAQFAHGGAVVIAINAPYFRRGGTPYLWLTSQDRVEQIQLIKDLRRAIDIITARADVDDERIGFIGHSYGGIIGAQLVGVEPRIKAAIIAAANGGQITHHTSPVNIDGLATLSCAVRNAWFDAMVPIEPIRFIPHASGTELLFQIALQDNTVLQPDAEALYNAAPEPKEVRYYNAGHGLDLQALGDRHEWLHEKIGIDP